MRRCFSSNAAFKKLRQIRVEELALEAHEFEHLLTGARYYHVEHASADSFSIAFRTLPGDSTGVPHILEHTALCGSHKFPVRDPFFKMLNRSLAVYMNAWTGSDFTQYPFITENGADYENLRKIYLDAVFKPLLAKDDFLQEGWRLLVNESSSKRTVKIGGIVYNEMKGALSDADSYFLTRFQQDRFGSNSVYSVVSGGDPLDIPKLTHEQLVAFHGQFYHPSNSVTIGTGRQIALNDNLTALEEYFSSFSPQKSKSIDLSRLFAKPSMPIAKPRIEISGPLDPLGDPSNQIRLLVSFLANDSRDTDEAFALKILCELLFEGPAAPFYKALIDSGLGNEYAPGTGYDSSTSQATISIGLQGLNEDKLKAVEETIDQVFSQVRNDMKAFITSDRVETVLHQIELGLRHSSPNFGLSLASSITQSWIHGVDPIAALAITERVSKFRQMYSRGGFFESLLDRYILNKEVASRLVFIMHPDPEHANKLEEKEREFVANLKLTTEEIDALKVDAERLQGKQNEEQNVTCLPCLKIDQVNPKIRDPALKPQSLTNPTKECLVYERKCPEANGLLYFKAGLRLEGLSERQILLMPLLLQCLSELGGSKRNSAADFDSSVKRYTGGLGFSLHQGHLQYPSLSADMCLIVSSYGLTKNAPKLMELLTEALVECNLSGDQERIKMLIASSATAISSSIASSGNRYAALKAASSFNVPRSLVSEQLNGLAQAHFITKLIEAPIEGVVRELEELNVKILNSVSDFKAALIHSDAQDDQVKGLIANFFSSFGGSVKKEIMTNTPALNHPVNLANVFVPGPFSSNFTAMALMPYLKIRPSARDSAILTLTAKLLRAKHLHREIREIGGAYGSGASFSSSSGVFTFSSYRDPSPQNSLNVFRGAGEALLTRDSPNDEDLLGAKLSAFSDLDSPVDISSRGLQEFMYGPDLGSDSRRQEYRDALLSCTLPQVRHAVEDVLMPLIRDENSMKICVIGEDRRIQEFKNDPKIKWTISNENE